MMKATGIVRRIDDLGRVVIPKEIRRSLLIRENDPMEIFTEDDLIIFRRYDAPLSVSNVIDRLMDSVVEEDNFPRRTEVLDAMKALQKLLKGAEDND